jgi:NAD(P)-dependent dehydrogenase (short-subunit alcohol dehydrogenase family)
LEVKVAVVTGGSAGIGQAAAVEIAKLGIGVVLTYRTHEAEAKETVVAIEEAGGAAVALPLDTSDISTFDAFITDLAGTIAGRWGASKIDFLVNNAGIGGGAPFGEVTEEMFDRFHRVLFKGPFFLTQSLLALMNDGGAIVNTGSNSALDTGTASGYSSYASQKGAVHVLTRCWAKELAPRRIRVNAVAPGSTRTRIVDDIFTRMPEAIPPVVETIPLGRIGEPEDIGRVIAFLVSEAGGWITGQVIEASGGQGL